MGTRCGQGTLNLSAKEVGTGLKKKIRKHNRKGRSAHGPKGNTRAQPMDFSEVLTAKSHKHGPALNTPSV